MRIAQELRSLSPMALRLVAMKFLAYVGMQGAYFVGILGTLTYALGGDPTSASATVGLLNLMFLLGSFSSGSLLDAMGPRRHFHMVVASTALACVLVFLLSDSVVGILVGTSVFGFAWGLADPVLRSYPAYLTSDEGELKTVNAVMCTAVSVGVVVGPLVGSVVSLAAPPSATLLFAGAMALLSLVPARGFLPERGGRGGCALAGGAGSGNEGEQGGSGSEDEQVSPVSAPDEAEHGGMRESLAGFRLVFGTPALALIFVADFLAFFGYGAFDALESLYYRDVLEVGVTWMGVLSGVSGVGGILGGIALMRLPARRVNLRSLLLVLALLGLACLVYVGTSLVVVAFVGQTLVGVAFGAFNPLRGTLVQADVPIESVGRVSSVMSLGFTVAGVVPLFLAPAFAEVVGVQGTLVGASVCVLVAPLAMLAVLPRIEGRGRR